MNLSLQGLLPQARLSLAWALTAAVRRRSFSFRFFSHPFVSAIHTMPFEFGGAAAILMDLDTERHWFMVQHLSVDEEKLQKLSQRKAQLQEREQALKASLRKKENAQKFNHGGLVRKAGLNDLSDAHLLGLLLEQKTKLDSDASVLRSWEQLATALTVKSQKQPITVSFNDKPGGEITDALKRHKLRWNRYARHWEGDVSGDSLEQLSALIGEEHITKIDLA
jgi:hypothetical protein